MKKRLIFTLLLLLCGAASTLVAQDIIVLKTGEEISAQVQEVGINEVKYKKQDNPSGPAYTLLKADIFMIKYANGEKDVFTTAAPEPVKEQAAADVRKELLTTESGFWGPVFKDHMGKKLKGNEVRALLADTPEALSVFASGSRRHTTGYVIAFIGLGVEATGIIYYYMTNDFSKKSTKPENYDGVYIACTGLAAVIVGAILGSSGDRKMMSAIPIYNKAKFGQTTASAVSLNFGLTRSGGIGLTLNF